jgi:glycosyltransferase involved in cell wall biosynthesis
MNNQPLVTVVIPTFNRGGLLIDAVRSAANQIYTPVEVIVVDDGSQDETAARQIVSLFPQARLIRQTNQGVAAARNTGLQAAQGEWISFLDDDDWIFPQKIARQIELLQQNSKLDVVHCGYSFTDQQGRLLEHQWLLPQGNILARLAISNFIWVGAPLVRRNRLRQISGFDITINSISADWDCWLRLALSGCQFGCVEQPLGAYRLQKDSMVTNMAALQTATLQVLDKLFGRADLPADLLTVKDQAYANQRFWLACRYYAAGHYESAQANLTRSINLQPGLTTQPGELVYKLVQSAFDPRIEMPSVFIKSVFEHLPEGLAGMASYQEAAQTLTVAVEKAVGRGKAGSKPEKLPAISSQFFPEYYLKLITDLSMRLPVPDPIEFARQSIDVLPTEIKLASSARQKMLAEVSIARAFQSAAARQDSQALRAALQGIWLNPRYLLNRGVLALTARAVIKCLQPK